MQISFVRRLDELGRIVIPKEIRNKLNFKSGDLLDLNINIDSMIIKKCNSAFNNEYIEEIINLVEYLSDIDIILTDTEKIIAKSKGIDDLLIGKKLSNDLVGLINEHKSNYYNNGVNLSNNIFFNGKVYVKVLIKDSNTLGLIITRMKNDNKDIHGFMNTIVKLLIK